MTTGKLYEKVAVQLSDAALLKLGKELAAKEAEYKSVEDEKAEALNTFNARLKTIEAEIADTSAKINDKQEEKDIEIREEFDYGRKVVVKVRADNGQPIGAPRPMTLQEMGEGRMSELREEQAASEGGESATGDVAAESDEAAEEAPAKGRKGRKPKAAEAEIGDIEAVDA